MLAVAGLLTVSGARPVLADARPSIVSVTLDANNHAVVTWSKEPWQASLDVWWSTGDGAVASPDPGWNTHYGLPLVDCWGGQQNGQGVGQGFLGAHPFMGGIIAGHGGNHRGVAMQRRGRPRQDIDLANPLHIRIHDLIWQRVALGVAMVNIPTALVTVGTLVIALTMFGAHIGRKG